MPNPSPGTAEWAMHDQKIPVAQYKELAKTFNPTKFDADAWVTLAKNAGMKYIVLTTKHHDGFAMFDSKVDPFNIVDATPFKRDPLKELVAACQKQRHEAGFLLFAGPRIGPRPAGRPTRDTGTRLRKTAASRNTSTRSPFPRSKNCSATTSRPRRSSGSITRRRT